MKQTLPEDKQFELPAFSSRAIPVLPQPVPEYKFMVSTEQMLRVHDSAKAETAIMLQSLFETLSATPGLFVARVQLCLGGTGFIADGDELSVENWLALPFGSRAIRVHGRAGALLIKENFSQ